MTPDLTRACRAAHEAFWGAAPDAEGAGQGDLLDLLADLTPSAA